MDSRQLRYFIAVAEEGHMGRAAERLNLSQPPLSRHIQALETLLGTPLFERTPHGMRLTHAGEALYQDARSIRDWMSQAQERARRIGQGREGRLGVGVYGSAMLDLVPRLLSEFRRQQPSVEVSLYTAPVEQQLVALRQNRIDIAFERLLPDEPGVLAHKVLDEELILALPIGHPLTRLKKVPVTALQKETLLSQQNMRSRLTMRVHDLCKAHGFAPKLARHDISDVLTATALVASGVGVCCVPQSLERLAMPGVVYRPLVSNVPATIELYALYMANCQTPALQPFLEFVKSTNLSTASPSSRKASSAKSCMAQAWPKSKAF